MKKIGKTIVKVIKKIVKFFDKFIITPIAKLFANVIDLFGNKSNKFEKFLINRQSLIIISLVCALLTFYAIDKKPVSLIDNSAEILCYQYLILNPIHLYELHQLIFLL